jgi:hypothetical protein
MFTANFLDSADLLEGECIEHNGARRLRLPFAWMDVSGETPLGQCWAVIRPEDMEITDGAALFLRSFAASGHDHGDGEKHH